MCLGQRGLGAEWDTIQAKDLRESISLQHICLNDEERLKEKYNNHTAVCHKWVSLLFLSIYKALYIVLCDVIEALFESA